MFRSILAWAAAILIAIGIVGLGWRLWKDERPFLIPGAVWAALVVVGAGTLIGLLVVR